MLLDTATARPVWQLHDDDHRKATYAALTGFAAVSSDGTLTALADLPGSVYVVDKAGRVLVREKVATGLPERYASAPVGGVGVWMDDAGRLAAFGYRQLLVLVQGTKVTRVTLPDLTAGGVSGDGSMAVVGLDGGEVRALDGDGKAKWTAAPGGVSPRLAPVGANRTLVATSDGQLVLLDADGKEVRRTPLWTEANRERHPLQLSPQYGLLARPRAYQEPGTLELAKQGLHAQPLAAWTPPQQGGAARFGRTFHTVTEPIVVSAATQGKESFLHVVYRRPEGNKSVRIVTAGAEAETFQLDLDTPEYRVVDIPMRGANPKASVIAEGPLEVAECSLWSLQWPGENIAYVRPAQIGAGGKELRFEPAEPGDRDLLLEDIQVSAGLSGKMKPCRIWSPNPDVDQVAGPWLKPELDPLRMVDGQRFGNGSVPCWTKLPYVGSWFTVTFGKPAPIQYVATYDRAERQSKLTVNLAVYTQNQGSEAVRAGVVGNDQFRRVFLLRPGPDAAVLGVHVYSGAADGLSEIEAYPANRLGGR